MYEYKLQINIGLWKSAYVLVQGQHHEEAIEVLKTIAQEAINSIGGQVSATDLPSNIRSKVDEVEMTDIMSLAKQINDLVLQNNQMKASSLMSDYIERIISMLFSSQTEVEKFKKEIFISIIHKRMKEQSAASLIHEPTAQAVEYKESEYVTTKEAAIIGGVTDQTIRRWCEKGKFPEAFQTDGGHWRIPQKYLKANSNQAESAEKWIRKLDKDTKNHIGEVVDEFDIDIEYS
ncbi:helix-turn-helix domain-containing protein [Sutcliffiella horikoshii]|uniref:helix-turn-helix domain-containing protein n=1 Tax=Sutcliffiella horikoshii TaxID=79883 RepID=UPI00384C3D5C